jgi:hypothetical protein
MNMKQGLVTGVLAMVIIGSVAFMPVNAGENAAPAHAMRASGMIAQAPLIAAELPADQVRDLTYK